MLTGLLHRMAAHPWVYDRIQTVAGNHQVFERLSAAIANLSPNVVLDIGGWTGSMQGLFAANCRYFCLDLEMPKLVGFRRKVPKGLAVLGDATSMPIQNDCADMVICKSVTHHLTELMLQHTLEESRRVLRAGGFMVLLDAVLNREILAGRILWRLDRGSHPRTEEELRRKLEERFHIVHWEKFTIYHEYVLGIGERT